MWCVFVVDVGFWELSDTAQTGSKLPGSICSVCGELLDTVQLLACLLLWELLVQSHSLQIHVDTLGTFPARGAFLEDLRYGETCHEFIDLDACVIVVG